jgi:hypothetical protein
MVADRDLRTPHVEARRGQCCGLHQIGIGARAGQSVITLDIQMYLDAPNPHDAIQIAGDPPLRVVMLARSLSSARVGLQAALPAFQRRVVAQRAARSTGIR